MVQFDYRLYIDIRHNIKTTDRWIEKKNEYLMDIAPVSGWDLWGTQLTEARKMSTHESSKDLSKSDDSQIVIARWVGQGDFQNCSSYGC